MTILIKILKYSCRLWNSGVQVFVDIMYVCSAKSLQIPFHTFKTPYIMQIPTPSLLSWLYPVIPENFQPSEPFRINKTTWHLLGVNLSPCENITSYTERWPCSFDEKLMDTPILQSAKFNGYFQSWKYWIQYENNLREIFQFQDTIAQRADKQLRDILSTQDFPCCSENATIVGIHVRRGDYTLKTVNEYGQITPNASYYQNAMDYFEKLYPQVLFIVASVDLKWTKIALKGRENVHISLGNFGPEDMALLSLTYHQGDNSVL